MIDLLTDVEIELLGVVVNVLKFTLTVSSSVDAPSDVDFDVFMDVLAVGALVGIGTEVLTDVSAKTFTVVMTP